jgi:hypothetical protein
LISSWVAEFFGAPTKSVDFEQLANINKLVAANKKLFFIS